MIRHVGIRPIIFSVNCYIATILAMFVAFSLDLKSPAWAMTTVYLTSQPLSGVLRAKAVYRAVGIRISEAAAVKLIGDSRVLSDHVESIAFGIEDLNRWCGSSSRMRRPTFLSWLAAQRPCRLGRSRGG
jgi:hypothetical protein